MGLILFNTFSAMYLSVGESDSVRESIILFLPTFLILLFGSMAMGFFIGLVSSFVFTPHFVHIDPILFDLIFIKKLVFEKNAI